MNVVAGSSTDVRPRVCRLAESVVVVVLDAVDLGSSPQEELRRGLAVPDWVWEGRLEKRSLSAGRQSQGDIDVPGRDL